LQLPTWLTGKHLGESANCSFLLPVKTSQPVSGVILNLPDICEDVQKVLLLAYFQVMAESASGVFQGPETSGRSSFFKLIPCSNLEESFIFFRLPICDLSLSKSVLRFLNKRRGF